MNDRKQKVGSVSLSPHHWATLDQWARTIGARSRSAALRELLEVVAQILAQRPEVSRE